MAAKTTQNYLDLITSEYSKKPKFTAMIDFMVAFFVQVQNLYDDMMNQLFDLDTPPLGDQLDIIGQWVGITRNVNIPVSSVFFTWDSTADVGWDYGNWQPANQPSVITSLPDDAYLSILRAKIANNSWDGTTTSAYAIWQSIFPQFKILIQDNCDMTFNLAIIGSIVDSLTLALITGGYIQLRPEGVAINVYYSSVDSNPAFAWDTETTNAKGWDEGSWLKVI